MELVAGQSLGRYEITGHLGAGGMGVVYRARDAQLGRDVAVKVLNDRSASQPSRIERFAREAQAVARLSHPNILAIHDFGTHEGIAYSVTELLQGQTLADRIQKGPIPLNKAFEICRAIAEGLAAAHGEGIIHRDIKPSNIFITSTGQVKILDFGIARLREQPADESSPGSMAPTESLTGAAGMIGTVGYMSPEQIDGKPVDGRSDIFGLGCVMYEILTGRRAFRGKTSTDTMLAILGKDPEPIRSQRPEVPQSVELIVERCLEKQPGERFESARDIAFALQAITDIGRTQSITNLDLLRRTKRRRVFAGMAIALAAAVALIAVSYRVWRAPPPLPGIKHLAVVPFSASGEAPQVQEYFGWSRTAKPRGAAPTPRRTRTGFLASRSLFRDGSKAAATVFASISRRSMQQQASRCGGPRSRTASATWLRFRRNRFCGSARCWTSR
jgi:serine/threonine protein kinase